jgi:hypothetical protein
MGVRIPKLELEPCSGPLERIGPEDWYIVEALVKIREMAVEMLLEGSAHAQMEFE